MMMISNTFLHTIPHFFEQSHTCFSSTCNSYRSSGRRRNFHVINCDKTEHNSYPRTLRNGNSY